MFRRRNSGGDGAHPGWTGYEGAPAGGVLEIVVTARVVQNGATVAIEPADADEEVEGHQAAVEGLDEITVTVPSEDGSCAALAAAWPAMDCLRGAVAAGFSLGVYEGGSADDLVSFAEGSHITALCAPHEGEYVPYILGAPALMNSPFRKLFPGGVPAPSSVAARGEAPATETNSSGDAGQ